MKRGIFLRNLLIFIILVLFGSFSAYADNETDLGFDIDKSFEWLHNQMTSTGWGSNVDALSWSILALKNGGYDVSDGVDRLKQLETSNYNWDNDVYDSSLATLALYKTGNNVDDEITWLLDRRKEALRSGQWLIQFLYDDESECRIRYEGDDFDFTINRTEIISPSDCSEAIGEYWVDFEQCIKEDDADMVETFSVSCLDSVDTSLLFKASNNYYIVDQTRPLKIENACFHGEYSGCRCTVTQYASWVLDIVGEEYLTLPYLRSKCNDRVMDKAFLYMLAGTSIYSDSLIDDRSSDGGWNNDFEETAMAIIALRDSPSTVSSSIDWLEFWQSEDGSWDGDIRTTAKVLYAMTNEVTTPVTPTNQTNTSGTCGNGVLDLGEGCEFTSDCSNDFVCQDCVCVELTGCDTDDDCGPGKECVLGQCIDESECTLTSECVSLYGLGWECLNGECQRPLGPGDECTIDSDCVDKYGDGWECDENGDCVESGSSWITWLIVFLILAVAAVGGYFGYKQFYLKKKGPKPGQPGYKPKNLPVAKSNVKYPSSKKSLPPSTRPAPVAGKDPREDRLETQLDKSLKKARDLLRGK